MEETIKAREGEKLMASKTNKRFNYKKVFEKIERSVTELIEEEPDQNKIAVYKNKLDNFKRRLNPSDEECFERLIMTAFYSGFKADTVDKYQNSIKVRFPSWDIVSTYTENDVELLMSDPKMIKHRRKIESCVINAKRFKEIVEDYGSFCKYIDSFNAKSSIDNFEHLRKDLRKFKYLGKITVNHFMKDIGFPVLKPDTAIMRIFERLGLVQNDQEDSLANDHGTEFAKATKYPIRYIDKVFVAFGQVATNEFGIKRGICLSKERRRCEKCRAISYCKFFKKYGMPSSAA